MKKKIIMYIASSTAVLILMTSVLFFAPSGNGVAYPRVFFVDRGNTISDVAEELKKEKLISSKTAFKVSSYIWGNKVLAGSYYLTKPKSIFTLAKIIEAGDRNAPIVKIKIEEGDNVYQIAEKFNEKLENFDEERFIKLGLEKHGRLYPDTYFFAKGDEVPERKVIDLMVETFERKSRETLDGYRGKYTEEEVIILASIVELEASKEEDRRKIAGVLFNRLEQDIPLQVDVSFLFISGKNTFTLSSEDLEIDDPANTYKNKGIPYIAVGNPTVDSIDAVINPEKTDYLFFLADLNGVTHFSVTHDEHVRKKNLYLK